jgi:phosphotransferase system HPr-like phosphotransfer protein
MPDSSIDQVVSEEAFAAQLSDPAEMLLRLADRLLRTSQDHWTRRHYFQLVSEAETVEAFLDDHGARRNRGYHELRELVASVRWLSSVGFSLRHLHGRVASYGTALDRLPALADDFQAALDSGTDFVRASLCALLAAIVDEARRLGVHIPTESFPEARFAAQHSRQHLPHNLGEEEIQEDQQKIAEVASKYLEVCHMLDGIRLPEQLDADAREDWFRSRCTEERARVFEATVHNLQSAYDTYIKGTVLEAKDHRLPALRGHASAAFHLLEGVTMLVHFVERHETQREGDGSSARVSSLVDRTQARAITLDVLLTWASRFMELGRPLAEELLPSYTNVQELEVVLPDDLVLHARPASLIVGIVNHHGTPVEMELEGRACNAGSILDLMVTVGSHPEARRFRFRGDEKPLLDVQRLFECGLGEGGLEALPPELDYLRG